jgi:hypothetical protein
MVWGPRLLIEVSAKAVRNVFMWEPLFGHLKVTIEESARFRLKLHKDPPIKRRTFF